MNDKAKKDDVPNKPHLYGGTMDFTQEGDCDGGVESLKIYVEDHGAGKFFVLETQRWSINDPDDLKILLDKAKKAFEFEELK